MAEGSVRAIVRAGTRSAGRPRGSRRGQGWRGRKAASSPARRSQVVANLGSLRNMLAAFEKRGKTWQSSKGVGSLRKSTRTKGGGLGANFWRELAIFETSPVARLRWRSGLFGWPIPRPGRLPSQRSQVRSCASSRSWCVSHTGGGVSGATLHQKAPATRLYKRMSMRCPDSRQTLAQQAVRKGKPVCGQLNATSARASGGNRYHLRDQATSAVRHPCKAANEIGRLPS